MSNSDFTIDTVLEISKKPFKDKLLRNKLLLISILIYAASTLITILLYVFIFPIFIFIEIPVISVFIALLCLTIIFIISLALGAFVQGIVWEMTTIEYANKSITDLTINKEFFKKAMKSGVRVYAIDLAYLFIPTIIVFIALVLSFILDYATFGSDSGGLIIGLVSILFVLPMYFVIYLVTTILAPTSKYFYLKTGNVKESLNITNVIKLLKKEWKLFALYSLCYLVIIMLIGMLVMLSYLTIFICIGIIIIPIVMLFSMGYIYYFQAAVSARIYQILDSKGY
jgi:MFS family permease